MKTAITFFSLSFLIVQISLAQNPVYIQTLQREYKPLENPFSINMGEVWDDPDLLLPIPLRTEFFDSDSSIYIYSFGTGAEIFLLTDDSEFKGMIPMDFDLIDRGYIDDVSESELSVAIEGTPGDRIFKMEWKNAGFYDELDLTGTSESFVNFQIWVYESEPYVEFHYGPSNFKFPVETFSPWSKIPMFTGIVSKLDLETEEIGVWIAQGAPENPELIFTDDIDLDNTDITGLSSYPADGTVYRFSLRPASVKNIWNKISDVLISPTIASEYFRFTGNNENNNGKLNYDIRDINGKIHAKGISENGGDVYIGNLPRGQYFVFIQQDTKWAKSLRLIKM